MKINKLHIEYILKSQLSLDQFKETEEREDYETSVRFLQRGLEGILEDFKKELKNNGR
jgi:hypothetical protein